MESYFKFKIIHKSKKSQARVGQIITPHGVIDTPNFVAVGTNGTLKALDNHLLDTIDQQLIFCNTYHLLLHQDQMSLKKLAACISSLTEQSLLLLTLEDSRYLVWLMDL